MRKLLLLFFAVLAYVGVSAQSTDLFFSEYIEGGSYNKALEIYNGTGSDVDLSDYVIRINSNGSAWSDAFSFPEGATLSDGDVYVLVHSKAIDAILAVADSIVLDPYAGGTSHAANFNGDDVRALCKVVGTDTNIIDIIGLYDMVDPGSGWAIAGVTNATKDHTIIRKASITSGVTDFSTAVGTDSATSDWIVYDKDYTAGLGWHINPPSNKANIVSFTLAEEISTAMIDVDLAQVTSTVAWDADLATLKPTIVVSEGAQVTATTLPVVFNGVDPVEYKVTAADGVTEKLWDVFVVKAAAPVVKTIYEIQYTDDVSGDSPLFGTEVFTEGIVTGFDNYGFYLQDSASAWNGIYVYAGAYKDSVAVGDSILIGGSVNEYWGLTQLKDVFSVEVISSDNDLPAAISADISEVIEAYESVIVTVTDVSCIDTELYYDAWRVTNSTDSLYIGTEIYSYSPALGDVFTSISGIVTFKRDYFRVLPRVAEDIDKVASTETDILTFTFTEQTGVATIDATNHTVSIEVAEGTDVTSLSPTIEISAGASVTPNTGVAQDFSSDVTYNVTAEDGVASQEWVVSVSVGVGIGVNELESVSLYPNPFTNNLTITNLENISSVMVNNVIGQNVMTINVTGSELDLNTENLQKGIYLITIVDNNNNMRTEKMIKQ